MPYINEVETFIGVHVVGSIPNIVSRRFEAIPGFVRTVYDRDMDDTYLIFEPTYLTEQGLALFVQRALEGNPIASKVNEKGLIMWRDVGGVQNNA